MTKTGGRLSALAGTIVQKYAIVVVWAILIIVFSFVTDTFFSTSILSLILGTNAIKVVLTLGLLVPLTAGDYDMSVASVLTLSSMIIAQLTVKAGWPVWAAILVAIAMGLAVGFINGAFVVLLNINPFIVTMGMATLLQGVTLLINTSTVAGGDLNLISQMFTKKLFGVIPLNFIFAVIICFVLWYFLEYTAVGKKILFVGRGINVARLSGVKVKRVRWGCFVASGFICALCGVFYTGMTASANPTAGLELQMPAFAAAFLGSTCIKPGRFNPWGALISVYFLSTGITGLSLMGLAKGLAIQNIFYGASLILAVAFSVVVSRRQEKIAKTSNRAIKDLREIASKGMEKQEETSEAGAGTCD